MTRIFSIRLALTLTFLTLVNAAVFAQLAPLAGTMSDIKPGSILIYPKYSSNPSSPQLGDTQVNMTNTSQNLSISVHLFAVDGSTCSVADSFINLTPNQTATFFMSDFDPGVSGYLFAVATDGGPTQHNFLIGDEYIRESDGRQANLQAYTVAKLTNAAVDVDDSGSALLAFNGTQYERLPSAVALSSFNSQTTDNTQVNMISLSNNLILGEAPSTNTIFTLVYNDTETALSTSTRVICFSTFNLSSLRIAGGGGGGLSTFVPNGRTGWIRFSSTSRPILGSAINRGPIFAGGHNLHILTLMSSYTIAVPNV